MTRVMAPEIMNRAAFFMITTNGRATMDYRKYTTKQIEKLCCVATTRWKEAQLNGATWRQLSRYRSWTLR